MKKSIIVMVVALFLAGLLAGCGTTVPDEVPDTETPAENGVSSDGDTEPPEVDTTPGELSFTVTPDIEAKLIDDCWISPGKVNIDNLQPGASAEYPLTIHNGRDVETSFTVTVRAPDNVAEGYERLPEEYYSWITLSDPNPVIAPKQSVDVMVVVAMPEEAVYPDKDAEFWVGVIEEGQAGMIRTELASRWLISTR